MSLTVAIPTGSRAARIVVLTLFIILALANTRLALSFALAKNNPELAYRINPNNAEVVSALAERRMFAAKGPTDAARVKVLAINALRQSPYVPQALRTVGFVVAVEQGEAAAEPILKVAGRGSLRDFLVHLWLFDKQYRDGAVNQAVHEADIVMSQAQDRWDSIMPLLISMLDDRRTIVPLANTLSRAPVWRGTFIERMGLDPKNADGKFALLTALKQRGRPATTAELNTYFLTAPAQMPVPVLRLRWLALVSDPGLARKFLLDGEFDGVDLPPPYVWLFLPSGDTYAERQRREDGQGNALYASFDSRGQAAFARQMLALAPGRYRFSGQMLGEDQVKPGQFVWTLQCGADGRGTIIERLPLVPRREGWSRFVADFTVPEGCVGQTLGLDAIGTESRQIATIWIDSLKVSAIN